jgi:hypothetical protein
MENLSSISVILIVLILIFIVFNFLGFSLLSPMAFVSTTQSGVSISPGENDIPKIDAGMKQNLSVENPTENQTQQLIDSSVKVNDSIAFFNNAISFSIIILSIAVFIVVVSNQLGKKKAGKS